MKAKHFLIVVLFAALVFACKDDETWQPAYITDFAEVLTDSNGAVVSMTLDNGTSYSAQCVANINEKLLPDTVCRAVCLYTLDGTNATISSLAYAFAPEPVEDNGKMEIVTDPCTIKGVWLSGGYVNARMLVQGKDQPHIVAFVDKGITTSSAGVKTLHILLYHDQNGDMPAFSRTVYLSCPLRSYADKLTHNRDSIHFIVNQDGEGLTTFPLLY